MERATILAPYSTDLSSNLASIRTQYCTPEEPEYKKMKKNINTISMYEEKLYQLHAAQRQLLRPLNNL